jgi:hypothetical protein
VGVDLTAQDDVESSIPDDPTAGSTDTESTVDEVCDGTDGECQPLCDLTGTFALKVSLPASWSTSSAIEGGTDSFLFWMRVSAVPRGGDVSLTLQPCGRSVPDFRSSEVDEIFCYGYPDSLFDRVPSILPSTAATISLATTAAGSTLSLPPSAVLMGARLDDPVDDVWPALAAALSSVDMDRDGKPGVVAVYRGDGPCSHPRTAFSFSANRADQAYVGSRLVFSLSGRLAGCTRSTGSAEVSALDTRIFGCRLADSGRDCKSSEADFLDRNVPRYTLGPATYVLEKVADSASCPQIRSALP